MFTTIIKNQVKQHALQELPNECCGLIINRSGYLTSFPCRNSGEMRTKHFVINFIDYIRATREGKVMGFYHSQPNSGYSELDKIHCDGHNMPSLIYSWENDQFLELYPSKSNINGLRSYMNRDFQIGVSDCFSLVRDYYRNELNILINNYERTDDWYEKDKDIITKNFEKEGFKSINEKNLQLHDLLLFGLAKSGPSHFGIYLSNNLFLHHPRNKKSVIEFLGSNWMDKVVLILRHKSLIN